MFKFDLKSCYHHADVFQPREYQIRYFFFMVLPFGLTSDSFIFIEIVRPLVKLWIANILKIACFLDDAAKVQICICSKHPTKVQYGVKEREIYLGAM